MRKEERWCGLPRRRPTQPERHGVAYAPARGSGYDRWPGDDDRAPRTSRLPGSSWMMGLFMSTMGADRRTWRPDLW